MHNHVVILLDSRNGKEDGIRWRGDGEEMERRWERDGKEKERGYKRDERRCDLPAMQ